MESLPIVFVNGKRYYFDMKLKQIRNVDNPHDFIDLTDWDIVHLLLKISKV